MDTDYAPALNDDVELSDEPLRQHEPLNGCMLFIAILFVLPIIAASVIVAVFITTSFYLTIYTFTLACALLIAISFFSSTKFPRTFTRSQSVNTFTVSFVLLSTVTTFLIAMIGAGKNSLLHSGASTSKEDQLALDIAYMFDKIANATAPAAVEVVADLTNANASFFNIAKGVINVQMANVSTLLGEEIPKLTADFWPAWSFLAEVLIMYIIYGLITQYAQFILLRYRLHKLNIFNDIRTTLIIAITIGLGFYLDLYLTSPLTGITSTFIARALSFTSWVYVVLLILSALLSPTFKVLCTCLSAIGIAHLHHYRAQVHRSPDGATSIDRPWFNTVNSVILSGSFHAVDSFVTMFFFVGFVVKNRWMIWITFLYRCLIYTILTSFIKMKFTTLRSQEIVFQ